MKKWLVAFASLLILAGCEQPADQIHLSLSEQRATAVTEYLQAQLPHHFASEGLGFSNPLPQIDPASPLNQRTVVRLVRIGG